MKQFHDADLPPELESVARRLGDSRATLDEDRAERMVTRIVRRHQQENTPLRTRLAIISMLVLGFAFSGSGVGLAISGSSSAGTSANQQYEKPDQQDVLGNEESGDEDTNDTNTVPGNDTSGGDDGTQTSRQTTVESGSTGSSLPFTGFAAVPVMLIGVALLTGGFVLRRRTALDR